LISCAAIITKGRCPKELIVNAVLSFFKNKGLLQERRKKKVRDRGKV
jgi:hypothetical protein